MSRNNIFVGLILLIALAVVTSPAIFPNFVARFIPGFYEGVPCAWLRSGIDRAEHQSILGRSASEEGLSVELEVSAMPTDAAGVLTIRIVLINNTVGPLAVVYNPDQVLVGDNGSSGMGLIFNPPVNVAVGAGRTAAQSIPEQDIRLLGPRQRCVHTTEIPAGNLLIVPTFASGQGLVTGYYRNNVRGVVSPAAGARLIYSDQGLYVGFRSSAPVQLGAAAVQ